jgi:hypothetical protein
VTKKVVGVFVRFRAPPANKPSFYLKVRGRYYFAFYIVVFFLDSKNKAKFSKAIFVFFRNTSEFLSLSVK